ncbi:hypothetical protein CS542_00815 [Pedobacter sp. IW39]|nr:hypothetical protein CS542_00815 [Pedobacter sp. IW39]
MKMDSAATMKMDSAATMRTDSAMKKQDSSQKVPETRRVSTGNYHFKSRRLQRLDANNSFSNSSR